MTHTLFAHNLLLFYFVSISNFIFLRSYRSLDEKEKALAVFVPESEIQNSLIYTHMNEPIRLKKMNTIVEKKYIPGLKHLFKHNRKSQVNKQEQIHCLKALTIIQSGRNFNAHDNNALNILNNLKQKIQEENKKYQEFVKKIWDEDNTPFKIKSKQKSYALKLWKNRIYSIQTYKQFYEKFEFISWCYSENDDPVEMIHLNNLLELVRIFTCIFLKYNFCFPGTRRKISASQFKKSLFFTPVNSSNS